MAASLRWIFFTSRKFSSVEKEGRSFVTTLLASLGICLGVMVLIVVLSVMNGFQMGFKDAIMEISSYHVRINNLSQEQIVPVLNWCEEDSSVISSYPFMEAQALFVGRFSRQRAALVRALPTDVLSQDAGLSREIDIQSGMFDVSGNGIVLGSTLARQLSLRVGDEVTILAMSGSSDTSLFSQDRVFTVTGTFRCEYADINATYAFIGMEAGKNTMGEDQAVTLGIKLSESNADALFVQRLNKAFPHLTAESWRSYNRTFFGALRVEKNMLMLLVFLIFIVVAINIYNGMKRMVYERREEIAVMSALGALKKEILSVFMMKGFLMGFTGAFLGVVLGLFVCINMKSVFYLLSKLQYFFTLVFMNLLAPQNATFLTENPMYAIYASIPARIFPSEVLAVFLFGLLSALFAAALAGRDVLKLTVVEVLHDE
ncbi:MAG TPA: ABC transporter permease [Treponema sp.]|nr:ABC transporter permease [Treponema sp.]